MKKLLRLDNFLLAAGILCIIGFAIRLGADYYQIQKGLREAPFIAFIAERGLEFVLPGVLCFLAIRFIRKDNK
jgi:hypothetical protein